MSVPARAQDKSTILIPGVRRTIPRDTEELSLRNNTRVTDEGLKELKELKQLTILSLTDTKVTDAGVKLLRDALPNCGIIK
jgi:hypothetical protein